MKICLLVLASDGSFKPLVESVKNTWGHSIDGVDVWYYYGDRDDDPSPSPRGTVVQRGNDLICGVPESVPAVLDKTLMAFKYLTEHYDYDFYFRCCAGSYVVKDKLFEFCSTLPKTNCYCGRSAGNHPPKSKEQKWDPINRVRGDFISGSGILFSKDVVHAMVNDFVVEKLQTAGVLKNNTRYDYEDISYSNWANHKNIHQSDTHGTLDICDTSDPIGTALAHQGKYFHLHFRHNTNIMYQLHDVFSNGSSK